MSESPELVTMNVLSQTASMTSSKTNFAHVIFQNIPGSYPLSCDIECRYVISAELKPSNRDWVGLYKVGWRSSRDYIYYVWSPCIDSGGSTARTENKVLFPGSRMPQEDGEFYQFCYVVSSGQVRGASTPFQFRQQTADDLIEVEDENGELLVVKTKTAVLEDRLEKALQAKLKLREELNTYQLCKAEMQHRILSVNEKCDLLQSEKTALQQELKKSNTELNEGKEMYLELETSVKLMSEEIDTMAAERELLSMKLNDLEERMKSVMSEKDKLAGQIHCLEEEKELMKTHCSSNETTLQGYLSQCTDLKQQVACLQQDVCKQQANKLKLEEETGAEIERLMDDVANKQCQLNSLLNDLATVKTELSDSQLNSAELMNNVETFKEALDQKLAVIERLTSEVSQKSAEIIGLQEKLNLATSENRQLSEELVSVKEERDQKCDSMTRQLIELKQQLERSKVEESRKQDDDGATMALYTALDDLKARYFKVTKQNDSLKKAMESSIAKEHELCEREKDLLHEVGSLKDRLQMGQEAYKEIFTEREKLKKLLRRKMRVSESEADLSEVESAITVSAVEKRDMSAADVKINDSAIVDSVNSLRKEVNEKTNDVRKYRELYEAERNKNRELLATCEQMKTLKEAQVAMGTTEVDSAVPCSASEAMLQPLPPPITPTKLYTERQNDVTDGMRQPDYSKMMACFDQFAPDNYSQTVSDNQDIYDGPVTGGAGAATAAEEEKFEDAPGEPQAVCPFCSFAFPSDRTENDMAEHIEMHIAPTCPMCTNEFNNTDELARHVETHFTNEFHLV